MWFIHKLRRNQNGKASENVLILRGDYRIGCVSIAVYHEITAMQPVCGDSYEKLSERNGNLNHLLKSIKLEVFGGSK